MKRIMPVLLASLIVLGVMALVKPPHIDAQVSQTTKGGTKIIVEGETVYLSSDQPNATGDAQVYVASQAAAFPGEVQVPKLFARNASEFISKVLRLVVVVAALLTFFYLISAGIDWITSGGDKGKTEKARSKIVSAIIGIIIVSGSFALYMLILNYFGIQNFEDLFNLIR